MQDEWTNVSPGGQLVKFTYSELPDGKVFVTAQIAGYEVVCSVILLEHLLHPIPLARPSAEQSLAVPRQVP